MSIAEAIRKTTLGVARRARERGPMHAAHWVRHHIHERYREWGLGIETAEFSSWRSSVVNPECHPYEPLAYHCIEHAINQVLPDPTNEVFLDYGSGKGRAVIVAATLPFRRVIGVELISGLCDVARENVQRAMPRLTCQNVEIVCADATQYVVPADVSFIYLYNPFWEDVLLRVQQQIKASLEAHPRKLRIAYLLNDDQNDPFENCEWLHRTINRCELWERVHLVAYETKTGSAQ